MEETESHHMAKGVKKGRTEELAPRILPQSEKPIADNPILEKPISENPSQLNTNKIKFLKNKKNNNNSTNKNDFMNELKRIYQELEQDGK